MMRSTSTAKQHNMSMEVDHLVEKTSQGFEKSLATSEPL